MRCMREGLVRYVCERVFKRRVRDACVRGVCEMRV